jgi:hypothetical protein
MGVRHYNCHTCGRSFPDCVKYFRCFSCNGRFCSDECGGKQVVPHPEDPPDMEEETTCVLCRKEQATDSQLLKTLLAHFNITHEQAMDIYRGK